MLKKYPKFILFLILFCLVGAGVFYFSNSWKGDETQIQTAQNLKLLNSHSHPEAGDEWVVSFETIGSADLIIIPTDPETIDDLDFTSIKCARSVVLAEEGFGKEVNPEIQARDVLFVPDWSCEGVGIISHLVNIARKHTLKFQFGGKIAFAYNNPDSVSDSFTDESKVSATSSVVVTGGQVYLAACQATGTACSVDEDCCSDHCVDSYCCDTACTGSTCQRCDGYSNNGTGTCGYVSSSSEDPDNDCPGVAGTCAATTCSGSDYSCGYLTGQQGCGACKYCTGSSYSCANVANGTDPYGSCPGSFGTCAGSNCNGSGACQYLTGQQGCAICKYCSGSSYSCTNYAIDTQPTGCTGCNYCNGNGSCVSCEWIYQSYMQNYEVVVIGGTAQCKPSSNNTNRYAGTPGGKACAESLYTNYIAHTGYWVYVYKCGCQ